MKKIFTLALCLATLSAAFAQSPYSKGYPNDNRNDGYASPNTHGSVYNSRSDDHHYNEQLSFSTRERDARISQINREYESRMNAIKFNRFMRNGEKRRELHRLEDDRAQEIRIVIARFENNRNKYNDRYYDRNYNWRN